MSKQLIGRNVIVRDNQAGVFVGTLDEIDDKAWTLKEARKIHYWTKAAAVEGLATTGFGAESRITPKVEIVIGRDLVQAVLCTEAEYKALMGAKEWKP